MYSLTQVPVMTHFMGHLRTQHFMPWHKTCNQRAANGMRHTANSNMKGGLRHGKRTQTATQKTAYGYTKTRLL